MRLSLDLYLLQLPTVDTLGAAHDRQPEADRQLVVVRARDADGAEGWGECSALNRPTYTDEWAEGAFELLASGGLSDVADAPMAWAGLDMARRDLVLKATDVSLASDLGVTTTSVVAGAVIGLSDDLEDPTAQTVTKATELAALGYVRLKLKAVPNNLEVIRAVREALPSIELQIDGNGSFDERHVDALAALAEEADLDAIEQPFAPDNIDAAIDLVESTPIPVLADEPIGSMADAEELFELGALSGVVIKPPKVGGIDAAADLVDWAATVGLPAAAGGMLESGLGRHALAAIAGLDGFSITGDLSPARRWLADDPFADLELIDGELAIPQGSGVAPPPNLEVLDRYATRQASVVVEINSAT